MAQRVGRGIALLFHDRGTRRGWVVSSTPRPHFNPRKDPAPTYRRLGGPQGRSRRAKNLVLTGIRSRPSSPVAQLLYRLSYPAHYQIKYWMENSLEGDTWEDQKWGKEGRLVAAKYKWMEGPSRGEGHLKANYRKDHGPKRVVAPLKRKKNLQGLWKI